MSPIEAFCSASQWIGSQLNGAVQVESHFE
jgi:hypothetical protein